jgi:hypothetical protein
VKATQRAGLVSAALLTLSLGAAVALRRRSSTSESTALAPTEVRETPGELPRDPLAWVPASARALIAADLPSLRRAQATRRWFAEEPADTHCAARLARRVNTVVLVIPRAVDDFAFVAAGDVRASDLARCVPEAEAVQREGVTLRVLRATRNDGGLPTSTLAWTPSGVVVIGSPALVERMLDRGFDAMHGVAAPLAMAPLRQHLRQGAALWAMALPGEAGAPGDPLSSVQASVLSAQVSDVLTLDGVLLCDDSTHARRAVDALSQLRDQATRELTSAPVRALLEDARASTDGARVTVQASLDAPSFVALLSGFDALAQGLARYLPTGPQGR